MKTGSRILGVCALAVSVMADDNFHGMRPDVVAHLAEIGTSIVSKQPTATLANGTCTITVPPASLIAVRLGK